MTFRAPPCTAWTSQPLKMKEQAEMSKQYLDVSAPEDEGATWDVQVVLGRLSTWRRKSNVPSKGWGTVN